MELVDLGKKQLQLEGFGGTGKTAILLRLARDLFELGQRCLVLTYHTALTSDLYRQLQVLGLRQSAFGRSVNVETLHRFFRCWLVALGQAEPSEINEDWFDRGYLPALKALNERVSSGEVSPGEISRAKKANPAILDYATVMVDEAQDWDDAERDFLHAAYLPKNLIISVGHRQLVRLDTPCDWTPPPPHELTLINLERCLRMKPNLALFVTAVARAFGDHDLVIESDGELSGGEVHILIGSPSRHLEVLKRLLSREDASLKPVDHLFCVPPDSVKAERGLRRSSLGKAFQESGYSVYDAVDREVRIGVPSSADDIRIVQYESCRGLEGWIVALENFDEFYAAKLRAASELPTDGVPQFLRDEFAKRHALDWMLIPLTRAIDTLVIGLADEYSTASRLLMRLGSLHRDFVTVHR